MCDPIFRTRAYWVSRFRVSAAAGCLCSAGTSGALLHELRERPAHERGAEIFLKLEEVRASCIRLQ
jgi:hypothetical protein